MELFVADGHDAGGCERVTGKSGMRPWSGVTFTSLRRLDNYSSEPLARSCVTTALFVGFGRDLPGVVYDRPVWRRDGPRGRAYPRGRHPDGARRIQEVVRRAVLLDGSMMTLIGMLGGAAITGLFSGWLQSILWSQGRGG